MLGLGLLDLSMAQLDALEVLHHAGLARWVRGERGREGRVRWGERGLTVPQHGDSGGGIGERGHVWVYYVWVSLTQSDYDSLHILASEGHVHLHSQ